MKQSVTYRVYIVEISLFYTMLKFQSVSLLNLNYKSYFLYIYNSDPLITIEHIYSLWSFADLLEIMTLMSIFHMTKLLLLHWLVLHIFYSTFSVVKINGIFSFYQVLEGTVLSLLQIAWVYRNIMTTGPYMNFYWPIKFHTILSVLWKSLVLEM